MTSRPLFSQTDLGAAFALILPQGKAQELAQEWFAQFASPEDLDEYGRFCYDLAERAAVAGGLPQVVARQGTDADGLTNQSGEMSTLRALSDEEKEHLLLRFSDLCLNLVSLVSPELASRIQHARGDSDQMAARRRAQTQRIVVALRRGSET